MRRIGLLAGLFIILAIPSLGCAHVIKNNIIDVRIVSDNGETFPKYETFLRGHRGGEYYYLEAIKGQKYSIEVLNKSERRIGVVIAVDGRNIINGKKSDLLRNERMYVIGPYETHRFEGWRTAMDRTNRFYFTEHSDSYAEKVFADASAMGTIALAVYKEKIRQITPHSGLPFQEREGPAASAPSGSGESRATDKYKLEERKQAGTGFGETTYSPAYEVQFDPEHAVAEKMVFKYEWRSELCRKGIISCGPKNRLWPDDSDFAPIPKDFRG